MSDRSTDELIEETERFLDDDSGGDSGGESGNQGARRTGEPPGGESGIGAPGRSPSPESTSAPEDGAAKSSAPTGNSSGWRSRLRPSNSRFAPAFGLGDLFSPKAFFVLTLALVAGLLVGGTVVPVAGRTVGLFAVAFLLGLVGRTRRYLEVTTAGLSVGLVAALASRPVLAVAGSTEIVAVVGAGSGVAACVLGYYFGRDLRAGLVRDVE